MSESGHGHDAPDLVGLLTGELDRAATLATARHLQNCSTCQQELSELAVAHTALRSSNRTERLLANVVGSGPDIHDPSQHSPERPGLHVVDADLPALPVLDEMIDLPDGTAGVQPRSQRSWGHRLVAASVVLLLVTAGILFGLAVSSSRSIAPSPLASATLHSIDSPTGTEGSVAVFADGATRSLTVATPNLPEPPAQHFYEVWLLAPSSGKMLPMGVLAPSGHGSYSVSAHIMAGYSAVDISLQANDGNPAHSSTSVLRARL
jgi:hypothetical protein